MFQRTIVIGGSSGIGEALCRRLAASGCDVAAVGRSAERLVALQEAAAGAGRVRAYSHDVADTAAVPALFQAICRDLGGLDTVVYAAGVMPRIGSTDYEFAKDSEIIAVNVSGAVAWLNEAAQRFAAAGAGTIIGIGSVAGERGRRGQPVYGASKAALAHYLEALRNRLRQRGVRVLTVKPGPVATPMTAGLARLPMVISAERAAALILKAARGRRQTAYVPERWRLVMAILRAIPSSVFSRLEI